MLCKILFVSAGHNLLERYKGFSDQTTRCLKQGYWSKKVDHLFEEFLKFFRIYGLFEESLKLLENFDVPEALAEACSPAFLLGL